MEGAGGPPAPGSVFPNMDFAAFAQACGVQGSRVEKPAELPAAVDRWLGAEGPAILHAIVDPDEIPAMPHIEPGQAARFGISKLKQAINSLSPFRRSPTH